MITYNNAEFVSDAILSVINQDYSNIQLVISDDASIDETPEIINSFQQKYPNKIIVNINKSNLGITKNTNSALKKCYVGHIFKYGLKLVSPHLTMCYLSI